MRKGALLLASCLCSSLMSAETLSGHYTSDNCKEVSISNKRTGKVCHPDKKGRFSLKGTELAEDTIVVLPQSDGLPVVLPLNGACEVNITDQGKQLDIVLKRAPYQPTAAFNGTIIWKESLKKTGEDMALPAINKKMPMSSNVATSFYGSTRPLYMMDGMEISDLSTIPLTEVAYVEIVRAGSSECAALGARGANGIIIVTSETKYRTENPAWNEPAEIHLQIPISEGQTNGE